MASAMNGGRARHLVRLLLEKLLFFVALWIPTFLAGYTGCEQFFLLLAIVFSVSGTIYMLVKGSQPGRFQVYHRNARK